MKTNYLLVDFENVQPESFSSLSKLPLRIRIFIGPNQNKIPTELILSAQELDIHAAFTRTSVPGKNSLDFHMSFWLGRLAEQDPAGRFILVSKDKGFDPLVAHLKGEKIDVRRVDKIDDIKVPAVGNPGGAQLDTQAIEFLKRNERARPSSSQKLKNALASRFANTLKGDAIDKLVARLVKRKVVSFENDKPIYQFSD